MVRRVTVSATRSPSAVIQWSLERTGRSYDCHTSPVSDDVGNVIGGMTLMYEVTDHKQLQSQLADSEARLSSLIENAADSMWSLDREGRLTAFNSRFAADILNGFGTHVQIGMCIFDVLPEPGRSIAIADLAATLTG